MASLCVKTLAWLPGEADGEKNIRGVKFDIEIRQNLKKSAVVKGQTSKAFVSDTPKVNCSMSRGGELLNPTLMEQHILKYEFHISKVLKFIEIY